MSLLDIMTYHDSIIREKCTPVESIDGDIQSLIDNMIETMYAAQVLGLLLHRSGLLQELL